MKKITFILCLLISATSALFAEEIFKQNVEASFYADKFHGRKTANGEIFNMNDFTAAHKTLPFGTKLKVVNLANGNSVIVRVNDRGPFVEGREIDLSKAAAKKLDMITAGTARVSLYYVDKEEGGSDSLKGKENEAAIPKTTVTARTTFELEPNKKWDIQLGSYQKKEYAENFAQELLKDGFENVIYQKQKDKNIIRVLIKGVPTEDVQRIINNLEKKGYKDYLIKERK